MYHADSPAELYVDELINKTCSARGEPVILKESAATAWVDGNNQLGAVVGIFCMELAIKKAKEVGIGFVNVKGKAFFLLIANIGIFQ